MISTYHVVVIVVVVDVFKQTTEIPEPVANSVVIDL